MKQAKRKSQAKPRRSKQTKLSLWYKRLSKRSKLNLNLLISAGIAFILLLGLFYYCTQRDNYMSRYFYADEHLNIKVEGKEGYEVFGLDVSRYQGDLDWAKVNAHKVNGCPISFVFIKASEGGNHWDKKFAENYQKAKAEGFVAGAYHYYKDGIASDVQAKHFIKTARLHSGDLAPVLDVEELNEDNVSKSLENILACMQALQKQYHCKPIFYTYDYLYRNYFKGTALDDYPLWIANYSLPDDKQPNAEWDFWQYSCKGRLYDCSADFDLNVFRSSVDDFKQYLIP